MRAVSLKSGKLALRDVPTPVPGPGQILVRTLACAICASDHHYMDRPDVSRADKSGMRVDAPDEDVVMGHEFCAEIVEYGPNTQRQWSIGSRITSTPALLNGSQMRIIGMAPDAPGGFGEYFLVSEMLTMPVPDELPAERIALTDAMAVGWYYTRIGVGNEPEQGSVPLVIGLGAIGLSAVVALNHRGSGPIVAADYSERRRRLARELGADVVIDPKEASPWAEWRRTAWGSPDEVHDRIALFGRPTQVIYESVGRDGVLADVVDNCEIGARILSCGGAAEDVLHTTVAHMKGLNIQIGGGPMPPDWNEMLDLIVSGAIDPTPLIGETVSLDELPAAIERARSPEAPVRIVFKS